jgi:hypothetical protein
MQGFAALWNLEIIGEQTTNKGGKKGELCVTSPLRQGFKSLSQHIFPSQICPWDLFP